MKRLALTIAFATYSLLTFGQKEVPEFVKSDDLKTGISRVETNPAPLAPGLTYVFVKEKHKDKKGDVFYFLKITMDHPFTKTLNNELTTDIEFGNGDFVTKRETKENEGWFDGTFTIGMYFIKKTQEFGMAHFIIKGDKTQIYCIDRITNDDYKNKFKELVNIQL
jgi:hypothetical protein